VPKTANIMKSVTCSITLLRCALKCKKTDSPGPNQGENGEHGTLELRGFPSVNPFPFQYSYLNV
jgi:hypothetical protein